MNELYYEILSSLEGTESSFISTIFVPRALTSSSIEKRERILIIE